MDFDFLCYFCQTTMVIWKCSRSPFSLTAGYQGQAKTRLPFWVRYDEPLLGQNSRTRLAAGGPRGRTTAIASPPDGGEPWQRPTEMRREKLPVDMAQGEERPGPNTRSSCAQALIRRNPQTACDAWILMVVPILALDGKKWAPREASAGSWL